MFQYEVSSGEAYYFGLLWALDQPDIRPHAQVVMTQRADMSRVWVISDLGASDLRLKITTFLGWPAVNVLPWVSCENCNSTMIRQATAQGGVWHCPQCGSGQPELPPEPAQPGPRWCDCCDDPQSMKVQEYNGVPFFECPRSGVIYNAPGHDLPSDEVPSPALEQALAPAVAEINEALAEQTRAVDAQGACEPDGQFAWSDPLQCPQCGSYQVDVLQDDPKGRLGCKTCHTAGTVAYFEPPKAPEPPEFPVYYDAQGREHGDF